MKSVRDALHLVTSAEAELRRELGLGLRETLVLLAIGPSRRRVVGVALAAGLETSTVSRAVDRLAARGLVTRHHVRGDRRGIAVSATDAGRRVADRAAVLLRAVASSAVNESYQASAG